jgi:hypothetical protein
VGIKKTNTPKTQILHNQILNIMATIKTTIKEYSVIQQLAKQQACCGNPIPIQAIYKTGGVMVTAPQEFLESLGF